MAFLAEFHWAWLTAAAFVGLLMGWVGVAHRGGGLSIRGLQVAVVVLVIAIATATAQLLPGRFGYWLDLGLMMFVAYIIGCAIGAWLRELLVSDHRSAP